MSETTRSEGNQKLNNKLCRGMRDSSEPMRDQAVPGTAEPECSVDPGDPGDHGDPATPLSNCNREHKQKTQKQHSREVDSSQHNPVISFLLFQEEEKKLSTVCCFFVNI